MLYTSFIERLEEELYHLTRFIYKEYKEKRPYSVEDMESITKHQQTTENMSFLEVADELMGVINKDNYEYYLNGLKAQIEGFFYSFSLEGKGYPKTTIIIREEEFDISCSPVKGYAMYLSFVIGNINMFIEFIEGKYKPDNKISSGVSTSEKMLDLFKGDFDLASSFLKMAKDCVDGKLHYRELKQEFKRLKKEEKIRHWKGTKICECINECGVAINNSSWNNH